MLERPVLAMGAGMLLQVSSTEPGEFRSALHCTFAAVLHFG